MWKLKDLVEHSNECQMEIDGQWVPARPINWKHRSILTRLREAWYVFVGKADLFIWPKNQ